MVITTFFYYKSITTLVQTLILYSRTKSSDIQAVCVYAYQLLPVKRGGGVDGRSEIILYATEQPNNISMIYLFHDLHV